ncbi:MAG: YhbY family RNA-binding protein [Bryobacterales bacterium]|nr:YhbY family RNA-binding protein [Bryobacterales bacterium]
MLTPKERQALKAQAHKLEPVVTIGGKGLTDAVVAEIDFALKAHELLKIRAGAMDRHQRAEAFSAICERTGAEPVQHVGKVFVIYRKKPDDG